MTSEVSDERLAEMLAGLEGVTPAPWVMIPAMPYDGDDDDLIGAYVSPAGVEGANGDPVCVFGTAEGSGHLFENEDDHHLIARCDPNTIRSLITELQRHRAEARQEPGKVVYPAECDPNCDDPNCPYTHTPTVTPETRPAAVTEALRGVDGQVIVAILEDGSDYAGNPAWLWRNHETGVTGFGRWSKAVGQAPYIRGDIVVRAIEAAFAARPANDLVDKVLAKFKDFDPTADDEAKKQWFSHFDQLMSAAGIAMPRRYDDGDMEIARASAFQDGWETGRKSAARPAEPSARDALQAIADLPYESEGLAAGHEEAYRAVEMLFDVPPSIETRPVKPVGGVKGRSALVSAPQVEAGDGK